eukprot:TRINITY_DN5723_c0_g1_i1.p1 TRINITY_DN5723_c0_g1~~TRINITY_DN5723_c0_g1_i1.p1  ORF type:complete len:191 (-),score=47.68 TRINITY_DN5723_c0_g1_i1:127-699(-)
MGGTMLQITALSISVGASALVYVHTRGWGQSSGSLVATNILLGVSWAIVQCSFCSSIAILAPTDWLGRSFACLTVAHELGRVFAPLYDGFTRKLLVYASALGLTIIGCLLLCYILASTSRSSSFWMSSLELRRKVGYYSTADMLEEEDIHVDSSSSWHPPPSTDDDDHGNVSSTIDNHPSLHHHHGSVNY